MFQRCRYLDEIPGNIQEAVELWAEGEDITPPVPSSFESVAQLDSAKGGMLMLVDVNFDFLDQNIVPVNISMPVYMRNLIDREAKAEGSPGRPFSSRPHKPTLDTSQRAKGGSCEPPFCMEWQ